MNKIGKIAHNISVRNTSQNDFIKIEITPSVFNIFGPYYLLVQSG